MDSPQRSIRTLLFGTLLCSVLWGSAFPGIKFVYARWEMDFSARLLFAGIRFALAGAMVLVLVRNPGPVARLKGVEWRWLLWMAFSQTFLQYLLFYTGLSISSGVLGALLVSAGSFWWVLLAPIFHGTPPPGIRRWLLLGIAAGGISLAVWKPGLGAGNAVLGALCFLGSTLAGIMGILSLRPLRRTLDPVAATGFSLLLGGLALMVCGANAFPETGRLLEGPILGMTLFLALISAAAFTIWNSLAERFPANILAGYRFLIPLCGVVLSTLFIEGESPGIGIFVGGVIVIGALIFLSRLAPEPSG